MADIAFSDLDTRLRQLEQKLQSSRDILNARGGLTAEENRRIAELDDKAKAVRTRLEDRLSRSHGVDWQLLKLELQNDLLLLTNSFRNWTRRLDNRFERSR